jgi:gliding motility-associated-like protein
MVTVEDIPHPSLGPGYTICEGEEVTLYAGDEEGLYAWSTGVFGQNLNQITVSDSGWYWVQVTQEIGCFGIDSVYVAWFPKATINEDGLSIVPTTCGGNNGQILGLTVTGEEPLSFSWYDADSNLLSNTLDLSSLGVGNYFLHILDGNGCTTISDPYTIEDAGDIEINSVEKQNTHCNQMLGEISIEASSLATGYLLYSIDNGNSWQENDSLFVNLPAGSYVIRVSDTSGCESVYVNNPVVIENIKGPEVTQVNTTDEIDYLENGQIDITANVSSGPVFYSIDNGNTFQTNDGLFTNLSAGTYYCMVKDDFGCDTSFIVEVARVISQLIEAIAGDGTTCIGNAAVVPLKLNNFSDIFKFHVKLTYDTAILNCDGYINVHPELETNLQASIIPGTDEIIISWQGEKATSLEENATMMELVFGAKEEGLTGESAFYNENLEEVNAAYYLGILTIYKPPKIVMNKEEVVCEGEDVYGFVLISGGSGDIDYLWNGPGGYNSTDQHLQIPNVQTSQAGIYTLSVNDTLNCTDSRDINLVVNQSPQIAFQEQDTIYAEPYFILEAGSGHESYLWNTGDTTDVIQITTEGLYAVFVTSTEQCKATDSVTILFSGEPFWMPTAFSPNGDGLNDVFKPVQRYDYVNSYHFSIYSRWGELIFETSNIEQGWEGNYKGKQAPIGTYVYRIVYTAHSTGAETQVKTGHLSLVK